MWRGVHGHEGGREDLLTSMQTEGIQAKSERRVVNEPQRIETTGTLEHLAGEINHYHAKCEEAVGQAVAYAKEAGDRLLRVKEGLGHGQWLPWLEENFGGTPRTAQAYMRIAENWGELEQIRSGASHLSIRGALNELTAPSEAADAPAGGPPFRSTYRLDGAGDWIVEHHYTIEEYAAYYGYRVSPPLLVDAEFNALLPPLRDEEYAGLERSLLQEGCRNAVIAWNNTILDGHTRYEICVKHGIDYLVADTEMESRNDAMIYIIDRQLNRKNLSLIEKAYLQSKVEVDRLVRERGISEEEAWEEWGAEETPPLDEARLQGGVGDGPG